MLSFPHIVNRLQKLRLKGNWKVNNWSIRTNSVEQWRNSPWKDSSNLITTEINKIPVRIWINGLSAGNAAGVIVGYCVDSRVIIN